MKLISKILAASIVGCAAVGTFARDDGRAAPVLSQKQVELLNFAYETAVSDGHKHPQYVVGIIMQESRAGESKDYRVNGSPKSIGSRVFGVAQIKMQAAIDVMKRWPEMWGFLDTHTKEELQARLILDDRFNIRVASKYALLMGMNEHPNVAITSYNLGPGGAAEVDPKTYRYTVQVKSHASIAEKYTRRDQ